MVGGQFAPEKGSTIFQRATFRIWVDSERDIDDCSPREQRWSVLICRLQKSLTPSKKSLTGVQLSPRSLQGLERSQVLVFGSL